MSIAGNVGLPDLSANLSSDQPESPKLPVRRGKDQNVIVSHVRFGGIRPVVIAGPCAVENHDQTLAVAHAVKAAGAEMLRGGAFKPRTSPHDFQGLGMEGLKILSGPSPKTGCRWLRK